MNIPVKFFQCSAPGASHKTHAVSISNLFQFLLVTLEINLGMEKCFFKKSVSHLTSTAELSVRRVAVFGSVNFSGFHPTWEY